MMQWQIGEALMKPRGYVTTWLYDDAGRVTNEIDALGRVTTYHYDPVGNQDWKPIRAGCWSR